MGCLGDKNKKSNISQTKKMHSLSMYTKHDRILPFSTKSLSEVLVAQNCIKKGPRYIIKYYF